MTVKEKDKNIDKFTGADAISQWRVALRDARRKLSESQAQSHKLRVAINAIESKIQAGEPWPEATQN